MLRSGHALRTSEAHRALALSTYLLGTGPPAGFRQQRPPRSTKKA